MKNYIGTIILTLTAIFASCSGNIDNSADGLVLVPDRTEIRAGGDQAVTFTVTMNGSDVTSRAVIYCVENGAALEQPSFSTAKAGTYNFYATYEGETSPTVQIIATGVTSAYKRNYCIVEFTSQHCQFCPNSTATLYGYWLKEEFVDETIEVLSFHSNSMGEDIFYIDGTEEMRTHFQNADLPGFVFDMRGPAGGLNILKSELEKSSTEYPAHCGLSLKSELSQDGTKANVTVGLSSSVNAAYRVAVFVVEDKIKAPQDTQTGTNNEYNHRDIVRKVVSATWQGDSFGTLPVGGETEKKYEIELDKSWNKANLRITAIAYDGNGYANNCLGCDVDGGSIDFEKINN